MSDFKRKENQILTEAPRKVRYLNRERFMSRPKNALKIGMINKEAFVVTMDLALEVNSDGVKKSKEIIKMHTFIQKEGDVVEEVPQNILEDLMKKIVFF